MLDGQGASPIRPLLKLINRENRIQLTRELIQEAKQTILISTHSFESWLDEIQGLLQQRAREVPVEVFMTNPNSRFFYQQSEADLALQCSNRLKAIGADVKFIDWHPDFKVTIVDGIKAIIIDTDCSYLTSGNPTLAKVASLLRNMAAMNAATREDYRVVTQQRLMLEQVIFSFRKLIEEARHEALAKGSKMSRMKTLWKWWFLPPLSFVVGVAIIALAALGGLSPLVAIGLLLACVLVPPVLSLVRGRL